MAGTARVNVRSLPTLLRRANHRNACSLLCNHRRIVDHGAAALLGEQFFLSIAFFTLGKTLQGDDVSNNKI
jgi:hypothetical protein